MKRIRPFLHRYAALLLLPIAGLAQCPRANAGTQDDVCLRWRWIGVQTGSGACPEPAGTSWRAEKHFAIEGAVPTPALRRFCNYESRSASPDPQALIDLVGNGLSRVDADCVAVAPQGRLADAEWRVLQTEAELQAGRVGSGLLGQAPVRLAVVDSNPTNAIDPMFDLGASPHGNALVTLAERLLCKGQHPCPGRVTAQLALAFLRVDAQRRDPADVDPVNGGYVGSIGDLARAIHAEVVDWRHGPPSNLILNLSVGWSAEFGGLQPQVADMPAPVQAVYAALADASCRGVLMLSAAGNRYGGTDAEQGPLLPAAWEQRSAPGQPQCQQMLGQGGGIAPGAFAGTYRPLLHAVSGIDASGAPLDNTRAGGLARLAAFADHAVAQSALSVQPSPTAVLTGSSVAALLASANAAVAWSWDPLQGPHEAIATAYAAASNTPSSLAYTADFCLGLSGQQHCANGAADRQVHRLSLCLTRRAAGPWSPGLECAWPLGSVDLDSVDFSAFDAGATGIDLSELTTTLVPPQCGGMLVMVEPTGAADGRYCPHLTLPSIGARPWVLPQPGSDLCPECSIDDQTATANLTSAVSAKTRSDGTLRIELADGFRGEAHELVLVTPSRLYRLHNGTALVAGARLKVTGLTGDFGTAMLALRVNQNYSALGPLLRDQAP